MDIIRKIISCLTALILSITGASGVTMKQRAENLRVTAYVVVRSAEEVQTLDPSHFSQLTDIILMGAASFDTEGRVNLCGDFDRLTDGIKALTRGLDVNCYLNVLGPGATQGETFQEQMYSQGERHRAAFESGVLEQNIKTALDTYGLDGVAFDYEFPLEDIHKQAFGSFLVSLDGVLGDGYKICAALSGWNAGLPKDAIKAIDIAEVMCYDLWDADGKHATMNVMKDVMKQMRKHGYKSAQLDAGLPFYARPTTEDAYWYDYKDYYDKIDGEGLVEDENTGLIASFNTPEVIYQKTLWAIKNGYGGVMIWNYGNDVPADNDASLFNRIAQAKNDVLSGKMR
ncbi:MAG: glycoside hydrolase family 18 protein [Clostridiales bacterium]|nr:glycoside hydrolase family 18 protein [Clostridiales bacterium]